MAPWVAAPQARERHQDAQAVLAGLDAADGQHDGAATAQPRAPGGQQLRVDALESAHVHAVADDRAADAERRRHVRARRLADGQAQRRLPDRLLLARRQLGVGGALDVVHGPDHRNRNAPVARGQHAIGAEAILRVVQVDAGARCAR